MYVRTYLCSFRHSFHKACIDRWLTDKRTCPLCKQDIVGDLKGKVSAWSDCSYVRLTDVILSMCQQLLMVLMKPLHVVSYV